MVYYLNKLTCKYKQIFEAFILAEILEKVLKRNLQGAFDHKSYSKL